MQIKSYWRPVSALLLLVFGLVSCSEEKSKPRDSFRISPPQLKEKGQAAQSWLAFKGQKAASLSALATIEFGAEVYSQAVTITAQSRCAFEKTQAAIQNHFYRPKSLQLFQLLPREVLLADPNEEVRCDFEFTAINNHGSKHHFRLPEVTMKTTSLGSGIEIQEDGLRLESRAEIVPRITPSQMMRYIAVRTPNGSDLRLVCEKHEIKTADFHSRVVGLAQFHVAFATTLKGEDLPLDLYPRQNCRLAEVKNGEYGPYSQLLQIDFQRRQLAVSWKKSASLFDQSGFYNFGFATIKNTTDRTIRLKLPRPGEQSVMIKGMRMQATYDYPVGLQWVPINMKPEADVLILNQGEELHLQMKSHKRILCAFPPTTAQAEVNFAADWVWTPSEVGPEWLQPFEEGSATPGNGRSSGVVNVFPHNFEQAVLYTSILNHGLQWESVRSLPVDNRVSCRAQR